MNRRCIGILIGIGVIISGLLIAKYNSANPVVSTNTSPTSSYIALGDSVAAGVGLAQDSDSSACDRTNQSYPYQIAQRRNLKLTNIACSGATISQGLTGEQDVNKLLVTPQLNQVYMHDKPDLLTLTIGANDAQWASVIANCYTQTCGTANENVLVRERLARMRTDLQTSFEILQAHYKGTPPRLIVTGYHQVFPASVITGCTDLAGITDAELQWGRELQSAISEAVKQAASGFQYVSYVPIDFKGHELCTTDPWVQGLNDTQPYHPTQAGQAAFADQIITRLTEQH